MFFLIFNGKNVLINECSLLFISKEILSNAVHNQVHHAYVTHFCTARSLLLISKVHNQVHHAYVMHFCTAVHGKAQARSCPYKLHEINISFVCMFIFFLY